MKNQYKFRFPIQLFIFRYGMTIAWQTPIVKMDDGSISAFFDMFDDD